MKKIWRTLCVLMALIMVAGCGGAEPDPAPIGGTAGQTDTPVSGGTMNIAIPASPETVNPLEVNTREMVDMFALIYDPLVRLDTALRPSASLAVRWEADEHGKVWTLYLREGVTFHNGEGFTSTDVLYTLDQLKQIYTSSTRTSLYSGVFSLISSYTAIDRYTVKLTLKEPSGNILPMLNFPIVQRNSLTEHDGVTLVGGTGAYVPQSSTIGSALVLKANEKWWRRTPYISTINVKTFPDAETALTSVSLKLVDIVHSASPTANVYRQTNLVNTSELMTQEFECIIPNVFGNPVLADVAMRQAIFSALDRKTIVKQAYMGHAVSVDVPLPPDSYLYDVAQNQLAYETNTTEQILSSLGYRDSDGDGILDKDGVKLSFRLIVNENVLNSTRTDAANLVARQLADAGIECIVNKLSWSSYQAALKAGQFDLAMAGFSMPTHGDLRFLLHSQGLRNYGKYQDMQLDELLNTFFSAAGETDRMTAAGAVQRYFTQQLPLFSLYFKTNTLVVSADIKGIKETRDMDVYMEIENWYRYNQGDENKVDVENTN